VQTQANAKLGELRIAFDKLKVEATRMHKALVRECGEDVPIDKILSGRKSMSESSHQTYTRTKRTLTPNVHSSLVH
jgi:hypothetical protein